MRMFKKVLAGFVAAAMVATMAGCGSSNSSTKDSGSDKAAAEATTEAAAPAKVLNTNAANKLIYCITPSTSNPYFGTVQTACKEEGEKLGYKVKCVSHDDDATKQSELFDTAISEGASAIVCDNAGADASIEAVQKAYDAVARGEGVKASDAVEAVNASYANDVTDEFVVPVVVGDYQGVNDGDGVIFFNFRQIGRAHV